MKPYILSSLLALTAIAHSANGKPNFIFVIADDQRWDAMGTVQKEHGENARYPWFETPNMDRLSADGPLARQLEAELEKQMKAVGFSQ